MDSQIAKEFCLKINKQNAFLVERRNEEPVFESILKLIDLRLLHVISEGIVKRKAGQRFMALILDYGFYVGMRASKNIDLYDVIAGTRKWEDLRGLPVFRGTADQA